MPYRPEYQRPTGWAKQRQRIMRRDAGVCYICLKPGADEVDHRINVARWLRERLPGTPHADGNLAAVHAEPCHAAKTQRERQAGQARRAQRRPQRRNPNIID